MNNNKSACFWGLHSNQIHKEVPLKNIKEEEIGVVIINRCDNCGKITHTKIKTVEFTHN